jgi:hypothetical protein
MGNDSTVAVMATLQVPCAQWVKELQRTAKTIRLDRAGEAVLTLADGHLRLAVGGVEFGVPAEGRWPGEARVSSKWLQTLARVPPTQNPLVFRVCSGRLSIAGSSMPCEWQRADSAQVILPIGAQLLDLLRLEKRHSSAALAASGLQPAMASARRDLSTRLKRALAQLAPLGVTAAELEALVQQHIDEAPHERGQPVV